MELIFKKNENKRYGNKASGQFIPPEKGRRAIFVPSWGVLEKEEVDYLVEASQEKEDTRLRKGKASQQKKAIEQVTQAVINTPPGERAAMARKITGGK